jgi:hypothetical protein
MDMKAILATVVALGFVSFANASESVNMKTAAIQKLVSKGATPARASQMNAPKMDQGVCNEKGEFCYPDSSYFCCSNLCVDMMCD